MIRLSKSGFLRSGRPVAGHMALPWRSTVVHIWLNSALKNPTHTQHPQICRQLINKLEILRDHFLGILENHECHLVRNVRAASLF